MAIHAMKIIICFFTSIMAEIDLKGGLCKEDCQGPAYANSL